VREVGLGNGDGEREREKDVRYVRAQKWTWRRGQHLGGLLLLLPWRIGRILPFDVVPADVSFSSFLFTPHSSVHLPPRIQHVTAPHSTIQHTPRSNHSSASHPPSALLPLGTNPAIRLGNASSSSLQCAKRSESDVMPVWPAMRLSHVRFTPVVMC